MSEEGYQSFVKIGTKDGSSDDIMELPREKDGTVLLSTVQAQYPNAIGLKYKSSSGGWRGIRAVKNVLDPPHGGWGEEVYIITESDALKRKASGESNGHDRRSTRTRTEGEDLIVLGIPYATTEEEIRDLFTHSCGEIERCQLKLDLHTEKSKGFCFIKFKMEEAAQEALKGHHEIDGRRLEVRLSKRRGDIPMKLFIKSLPSETTEEDVEDFFAEYGRLIDVFVPNPFRGCAFITYSAQEDAAKVLRRSHNFKGVQLRVAPARPKEGKSAGRQENFGVYNGNGDNYKDQSFRPNTQQNTFFGQNVERNSYDKNNRRNPLFDKDSGHDRRSFQEPAPPAQKELASQLTDMFLTLIQSQSQK